MKTRLILLPIAAFACTAHASCGSSFCTVNTQWDTQGLSNNEGLLLDLRYSYARADRLRAGASKISPETPSGSDEEIENKRTVNQMLTFSADYAINSRWNVGVSIPTVRRDHTHTFDSSLTGPFEQQAKFTGMGDARIIGKYKFALDTGISGAGIRFGAKLPTGATNKTMTPPDPNDPTTPYKLERSSQPGTGSTDAIIGAYYYQNIPSANWGWFVNGQVQSSISTRDNYRPGTEASFDIGMHYTVAPAVDLLLQLNGHHRDRDAGLNANPASGGYSWSIAPGISYAITSNAQIYGMAQFALRQYANTDAAVATSGQLTAPWNLTAGVSYRF